MNFKLRIRLPDGRSKKCGTGTSSRERYDAMRSWVQSLKKGRHPRADVLEALVTKDIALADAYELRHDPDQILSLTSVRDIEPYVAKWVEEKSRSRKGAASATAYEQQVRNLIPLSAPFPASRFTAAELRKHLRALDVQDPTRNRHKAAFSSFADYLVDEGVLERNPVRDIKGWSEGAGRTEYYTLDEARRVMEKMPQLAHRAAFALAVGAGLEWQVLYRLRVRDLALDLAQPRVWADGGKTAWRRRMCRIIWPWCLVPVREHIVLMLPDAPLFPWSCDKPILKAIEEAAKAAKLPRLTLHDQRHTHAVNMLQEGYKPQVVAHQLGHRDTTLVWKRYGRYVVDDRDYQLAGARDGTNG